MLLYIRFDFGVKSVSYKLPPAIDGHLPMATDHMNEGEEESGRERETI